MVIQDSEDGLQKAVHQLYLGIQSFRMKIRNLQKMALRGEVRSKIVLQGNF